MTAARDLTVPGLIVGTVQHVSRADRGQGHRRADLFAPRSVFFEMLSGRRAFEAEYASVMAAILEREPPSLSTVQPRATPALDRPLGLVWPKIQTIAKADRTRSPSRAAVGARYRCSTRSQHPSTPAQTALLRRSRSRGSQRWRDLSYVAASGRPPRDSRRVARLRLPRPRRAPGDFSDGDRRLHGGRGGNPPIWVKLIAGGAPLQLTRGKTDRACAGHPIRARSSSSPHHQRRALGDAVGSLWLGGVPRRIVDSVADADVSHDGSRLAFVRSADGRLELDSRSRRGKQSGHRSTRSRLFLRLASLVAGRYADRAPTKQDEPRR